MPRSAVQPSRDTRGQGRRAAVRIWRTWPAERPVRQAVSSAARSRSSSPRLISRLPCALHYAAPQNRAAERAALTACSGAAPPADPVSAASLPPATRHILSAGHRGRQAEAAALQALPDRLLSHGYRWGADCRRHGPPEPVEGLYLFAGIDRTGSPTRTTRGLTGTACPGEGRGRAGEPNHQGSDRQTRPLREPRPAPAPPRRPHGRLQFRPPAQGAQQAHGLRIHRQDMDVRARPVHRRPDPPDAGAKQ